MPRSQLLSLITAAFSLKKSGLTHELSKDSGLTHELSKVTMSVLSLVCFATTIVASAFPFHLKMLDFPETATVRGCQTIGTCCTVQTLASLVESLLSW